MLFHLFAIVQLALLFSNVQARLSSADSVTSALTVSSWASSLMCTSAAVGPPQQCTPNIENAGSFLDSRMLANVRTSFAYNVELATDKSAALLLSSWLQPLYARLGAVTSSAALCDGASDAGFFGTQLSDPLVTSSFTPSNAGACNISSLDAALSRVAVSYKERSPARITSYVSMRSGSSRVHVTNASHLPPVFDARILPLVSAAHGARTFVFLIDGSFAFDSKALRSLIRTSIQLTGSRDLLQVIWATSSGPTLPLCRESLKPSLASADFKQCLIKMSRDMEFSGLAQLMLSMSMAEEIVSAHDGGRKAEIIFFASSSSPAFPFKDVYQGAGCLGRSSSSFPACPYRSMLDLSSNSSSPESRYPILHSVILTPKTSTRFPEVTCQTTGAAVFLDSKLCSKSLYKCTSALAPIFMAVSSDFVEFTGSSPSWLPADDKCALALESGLPLSCGPTLSHSSYVSNSSEANVIAGVSSAEIHPTEVHDVLRDVVANVSLNIHGVIASNVELLLVHVASGVVLGSSRLSTLFPNKDAMWNPDSNADLPNHLLENGFKNFLPCCSGTRCRCHSGQPNQVVISEVADKYQIPMNILKFQNVTCSSAKFGIVACSALLDSNLAIVVIAQGRRTVASTQVVLSGEKLPDFANFPISVLPAMHTTAALCASILLLPQAAQLIGVKPACAQLFRSVSSIRFCRGNISVHYAPCSWRSSFMAMQGLDESQSQHLMKFLAGLESSYLLPFSGLHMFAIIGSTISFGLMQTALAPQNDMLSVFFGYRMGVFMSKPARAVPPTFDHTLMDWFISCASISYSVANSNDFSIFPVRFVILPLRQSFAALSAQQLLPPVLVVARPAFYTPSVSQESDSDNFVGVFGVEVDIPSFTSVLNRNEICRLESSNCILIDHQGWIIMDRFLQDPLTAMAIIQQQELSDRASAEFDFQLPLSLHLSRRYNTLTRELLARGIARSSSASTPLRGGLLSETILFQIHLPLLPAVFELASEGVTVSASIVPWSNAVLFVLGSSTAFSLNSANSFGCGFFTSLVHLEPIDVLVAASVPVPHTTLRQTFSRNSNSGKSSALALPWATKWSATISEFYYVSQNLGAEAAPLKFNGSSIANNAAFFSGTLDLFTVHTCDLPGLPISAILAAVFSLFGLLVLLILMFKHFQAVNRLFNITVQMSLDWRNLSYFLYLLSKVEAAQRAVSGVTIFEHVLHLSSDPSKTPISDLTESTPQTASANSPDWEREGRLWSALEVKLCTAIDESEYSAALKELCSVSVMSSFMNASLLLASLSDYNAATRAQIWPCIDMVKDNASVLSARLQRLEMIGVVLVGIQSMIEKLQSNAEKSVALNSKVRDATVGSSLAFLQRHYSDSMSPQLEQARSIQVARRIVATALAISDSVAGSEVAPTTVELQVQPAELAAEEDLHALHGVDELSLESARSASGQAGGYFVDPSVITMPSGSSGSATITLRLNAAGRHEQQASIWRRAYLGRLHRELQGETPSSSNISAENWALIALRAHASQRVCVHADDPDQLLPDNGSDLPNPVALRHATSPPPIRPRLRRVEDASFGFLHASESKKGSLPHPSSGLGAALLSVFNDIVADNGSHGGKLSSDFNVAKSDFEDKIDVDVSVDDAPLSPQRDEVAKSRSSEIGAILNLTSITSLQDTDLPQDDPVSVILFPPENFGSSATLCQTYPVTTQIICVDRLEAVVPPEKGVATPRRAKSMTSILNSQQASHPTAALSIVDNHGEQRIVDQEMDM